jgi:2-oxoglutarate dehydrogenase E2 component (dihydrolipoamide succinyltransferase)
MSVEVKVPTLGESIVEATVGRWLKSEGDSVAVGDPLVELETDKVNVEVAASAAGKLQRILRRVGETVGIGEALAEIGNGQEVAPPTASPAPQRVLADQDARAAEGHDQITEPMPAVTSPAPSAPAGTFEHEAAAHATPIARRMAEENGLDLAAIPGSGPGGRITHDDVAAALAQRSNGANTAAQPAAAPVVSASPAQRLAQASPSAPAAPRPAPIGAAPTPTITPHSSLSASVPSVPSAPFVVKPPVSGRVEERVRMSRRRQTIARRLVEAQQTAAMLTTFNEVDMSAVIELRKRRRDAFKERYGVSLGFMSFFTKATVGALKAYPRLNAEIVGDEMVLKRYYDIGIAVNTPEGLVVPVVRDADRLSFAEIERAIASLAEKARDKTLSLEELQGGTFSISNGGVFGSLLSTPILNYPQVGILGMHKVEERPIAQNGQVVIHPMMYVALTYDHRIVDGAEAVGFLVRVKELIEDPERLLLEG